MLGIFSMDSFNWANESLILVCGGSFLWGLGSALLSPCHLGIIPILGSHAAGYGVFGSDKNPLQQVFLFTLGVFLTIPFIGFLIGLIGYGLHLGGHYWTIPSGLLLLWLGIDMMRGHGCSYLSSLLGRLRVRLKLGVYSGAILLGLIYGFLAGGCSTGFLVPIYAITLPQGISIYVLIAACFGLGHTLPMAVAGCSASLARRFLYERSRCCDQDDNQTCREPHKGEDRFRKIVGLITVIIGILFILHPFLEH